MISMKALPTLGFDTVMQLNQKLGIPNEPSEFSVRMTVYSFARGASPASEPLSANLNRIALGGGLALLPDPSSNA
jgi:hypothetical protein